MATLLADPWTALGDRTRREVLMSVASGPSSVATIARELPISRPAVSQHLKVLKEAGLVSVEPRGRQRIYTLRPEGLQQLHADLDAFWRRSLDNFKRVAEESNAADLHGPIREDQS
ncbi:MAG: ArsR/SmtB family transcription factor [Nocardioidaceae bacterium]